MRSMVVMAVAMMCIWILIETLFAMKHQKIHSEGVESSHKNAVTNTPTITAK